MATVVAKWKRKDPNDEADYFFDWGSDIVAANLRFLPEDETITAHTVTVPSPLTMIADSHTDKVVRFRVADGVDETDYLITCLITTSSGQVFETTNTLPVRNRIA